MGVASASSLSTSPIDTSGEARGAPTSTFLCRFSFADVGFAIPVNGEGSIFLVLRGSTFLVPQGLDFLVLRCLDFLVLCCLDFLVLRGSISWSIRGLDFFVLSGARFTFGPLRARFSWSISGARFFWSFEGSNCWSIWGSSSWSAQGLDFFCSFRGLDFHGPFGPRFFLVLRGPDFSWSLSGIHCLAASGHVYYLQALGGLVSLGLSVLSPFRISGLAILTHAQAHCSCFFRHRCSWRPCLWWRGSRHLIFRRFNGNWPCIVIVVLRRNLYCTAFGSAFARGLFLTEIYFYTLIYNSTKFITRIQPKDNNLQHHKHIAGT